MDALVLTRAQVRALDRLAVERLAIPSLLLMENAGAGAARVAERMLATHAGETLVLCGAGNNGGDGFVLARHLHAAGRAVRVLALAREARGDAAVMRTIVERLGLDLLRAETPEELAHIERELAPPALVVDALLGTGFEGSLRPEVRRVAELGERWRAGGARVLALDLPSGLEADSGRVAEGTLRATRTATFAALKPGLLVPAAQPWVGEVELVGLGFAPSLAARLLGGGGVGADGAWTAGEPAG